MLRLTYVVLVIATCSITAVESLNCRGDVPSIPVCSDVSMTSDIVYLSGVRRNDDTTQCSCSLSSGTPTNVTITYNQLPIGCGYKFQFVYTTTSWVYSCRQIYPRIIQIKTNDSIEINLLPDNLNTIKEFLICVQLQGESSLTLSCGKSRWPTSSYKPEIETSATENATPSGEQPNQPTTTATGNQANQPTSKKDNSINVIIGGSVGGLILLVIIIVVIVCVVRKRKREVIYESTDVVQNDPHTYSSISEKRSGEITHQPKATNETLHVDNTVDNNTPTYVNQQLEHLQNEARSDYVVGDKLPVAADYVNVEKSEE